jgi:hypothetical protein
MKAQNNAATSSRATLPGFLPFPVAWTPGEAQIFASEASARWFMRNHKNELVQAEAIALHAGAWHFDPVKFAAVARAVALRRARDSVQEQRQDAA